MFIFNPITEMERTVIESKEIPTVLLGTVTIRGPVKPSALLFLLPDHLSPNFPLYFVFCRFQENKTRLTVIQIGVPFQYLHYEVVVLSEKRMQHR